MPDKVAVVIPAYNEAASIGGVVSELARAVNWVIVVNDCSTDETGPISEKSGAIVVNQPKNRGYDAALDAGVAKAESLGAEFVLTCDGDGQHKVSDVLKFVEIWKAKDVDLVVGIRPYFARWSEKLFSLYARFRFGLKDPLCGIKGYAITLYNTYGGFNRYQMIGTELALFGLSRSVRFAQEPIEIQPRQDQPRFTGLWGGE